MRDEASWIAHLSKLWGPSGADVGLGDDACVLPPGRYALSTDTLVEGVDFERDWAPPQALGYKALAANLSDLAAMGARPRFFLMTLGLPKGCPDGYVEGLLEGMRALSGAEALGLSGGDLSRSPGPLFVTLAVAGEQSRAPILRTGGRPGDAVYVSGSLGAPKAALALYLAGERLEGFDAARPPQDGRQALLDRFYRPPSQTALGLFLSEGGAASACLDLSDGLQRDLARLCEASGCGAEILVDAIPLDPLLPGRGEEALRRALEGGEEQVLLFSVPPGREGMLALAPGRLYRIGRLTEGRERVLIGRDGRKEELPLEGFDHFAP